MKPTAFEKQDQKDSEDADSFDDDKQKSEVLQELDFAEGEHDQPNASLNKSSKKHRSNRKKKRKVDDGTIQEEVTEKSNEDEDERRD